MRLSSNRIAIDSCTIGIFLFLGFVLPAYLYFGTKDLSTIRNVGYIICCIFSFVVMLDFLQKKKSLTLFCHLLVFFLFSVLTHLVIARVVYQIVSSENDIIGMSYCIFSLIIGTRINEISNHKIFKFVVYLVWCLIGFFVFASFNPVSFQSVYGTEDAMFSGAYQYIGDTFGFVSILLIFQELELIKFLSEKFYLARKLKIERAIVKNSIVISTRILLLIILSIVTLLASNIILFANSSRASFFSFVVFTIYIGIIIIRNKEIPYSRLQLSAFILILISFIGFYLLYDNRTISNFNADIFLSNRNLELFSSDSSSSLDERILQGEAGKEDIINSPIFGNYIHRVIDRGPGTYMHNTMQIAQDFGIPSFISLWGLIAYCIDHLLKSSRSKKNNYSTMVFNSLLIFSIVQLVCFRNPVGFYVIYINFGMILREQLYP